MYMYVYVLLIIFIAIPSYPHSARSFIVIRMDVWMYVHAYLLFQELV